MCDGACQITEPDLRLLGMLSPVVGDYVSDDVIEDADERHLPSLVNEYQRVLKGQLPTKELRSRLFESAEFIVGGIAIGERAAALKLFCGWLLIRWGSTMSGMRYTPEGILGACVESATVLEPRTQRAFLDCIDTFPVLASFRHLATVMMNIVGVNTSIQRLMKAIEVDGAALAGAPIEPHWILGMDWQGFETTSRLWRRASIAAMDHGAGPVEPLVAFITLWKKGQHP